MKLNSLAMHEIIESRENIIAAKPKLIHTRTGIEVACFESSGLSKRGKTIGQVFTADAAGFKAMQLYPLSHARYFIRLTNGAQIQIQLKELH